MLAGAAYWILQQRIILCEGRDSALSQAIGRDFKGKTSPFIYAVAIPSVLISPWIAIGLYMVVALIWLVPDRRIDRLRR